MDLSLLLSNEQAIALVKAIYERVMALSASDKEYEEAYQLVGVAESLLPLIEEESNLELYNMLTNRKTKEREVILARKEYALLRNVDGQNPPITLSTIIGLLVILSENSKVPLDIVLRVLYTELIKEEMKNAHDNPL